MGGVMLNASAHLPCAAYVVMARLPQMFDYGSVFKKGEIIGPGLLSGGYRPVYRFPLMA